MTTGDLYLVDYARPSEVRRGSHCTVGLTMSRGLAREVLGADIEPRAGMKFPSNGLARVLGITCRRRSTRRTGCPRRSGRPQRQRHVLRRPRVRRSGLTPDRIVQGLGCSRAALYRTFAAHGRSVAAAIWQARLERARGMLASPDGIGFLISEIAVLSGFHDMPSFARMFKRRYGMTPRDAREASRSG
jgi:AraC-like DNA-binding protein